MIDQCIVGLRAHIKFIILFTFGYLLAYQVQLFVLFPLESQLGWEVTDKASIFFLPAGVQLLAFYFLRLWFIPVVLIGRTLLYLQYWGETLWLEALVSAIFVAWLYPFLLNTFENAGWFVFGTEAQPTFTVTGIVIFQIMATLATSIVLTMQHLALGQVAGDQAFQYTLHFLVGDVTGAVGVMYIFYLVMTRYLQLKASRD